jgi:hypothetical protein
LSLQANYQSEQLEFVKSVGISGYGNIDRVDSLAGAMNFLGFRSKTGKKITETNLKKIKQRLTKKYGR